LSRHRRGAADGRNPRPAPPGQFEAIANTHNVYLSQQALDIMVALRTCASGSKFLLPSHYDADRSPADDRLRSCANKSIGQVNNRPARRRLKFAVLAASGCVSLRRFYARSSTVQPSQSVGVNCGSALRCPRWCAGRGDIAADTPLRRPRAGALGAAMTLQVWIGLAPALAAFAYLVYALLKAEDFS